MSTILRVKTLIPSNMRIEPKKIVNWWSIDWMRSSGICACSVPQKNPRFRNKSRRSVHTASHVDPFSIPEVTALMVSP